MIDDKPHDAGSHDQKMTPALQAVIDAADKRARDKAAMPADCTSPTGCREHGCHGACLPADDGGGVERDGEPAMSWLVEGGIHALPAGCVLVFADKAITDKEGSGEVHAADQLRTAIAAERAKADALRTVMIAAAEEIAAHWDAHCDAEGYGPQNLIRRLEEGIPSEYGYTAGRFAELQAELSTLRHQLAEAVRDAQRYRWLRDHASGMDAVGDPDNAVCVWYVRPEKVHHALTLDAAIDAGIAAQGEAKPPGVERELFEGE